MKKSSLTAQKMKRTVWQMENEDVSFSSRFIEMIQKQRMVASKLSKL